MTVPLLKRRSSQQLLLLSTSPARLLQSDPYQCFLEVLSFLQLFFAQVKVNLKRRFYSNLKYHSTELALIPHTEYEILFLLGYFSENMYILRF